MDSGVLREVRRVVVGRGVEDGSVRYARLKDDGANGYLIVEGAPSVVAMGPKPPRATGDADAYRGREDLGEVLREMGELCEDLSKLAARRDELWCVAWASGHPITKVAASSGVTASEVYRVLRREGIYQ